MPLAVSALVAAGSHHPRFFTNAFQTVSFDLMMDIVSGA
jgi:hypothetical protein